MTGNPSLATHPNVEDWIAVRADGGVEVRSGKVEVGQGIDTAVALIVADELGGLRSGSHDTGLHRPRAGRRLHGGQQLAGTLGSSAAP